MGDNVTDLEKAYIAGIIDGEGSISVGLRSPNYEKREITCQFVIGVSVAMCSENLINWLKDTTGFGIVYYSKSKNPKHKDHWQWRMRVNDSCKLLHQIREFLILKKPQAELYLELCSIRAKKSGHGIYRNNSVRQFEIYELMKILNRRGPSNS